MVPAEDPPKVKLENFLHNFRVPELGELSIPWFMRVLGFLLLVGLIFIPWHRGLFLVGKIFINVCILWDPFLVGIPLIRVSHGAQDVSLYVHGWGPRKATSDPSKVYLSLSASFCQLFSLSMHYVPFISSIIDLEAHPLALRWNRRIYGVVYECTNKVIKFIRFVSFASSLSNF